MADKGADSLNLWHFSVEEDLHNMPDLHTL